MLRVLGVALLLLLQCACSSITQESETLAEVMREDMAWIARHSDYSDDIPLPKVRFLSFTDLQIHFHGKASYKKAIEEGDVVAALYTPWEYTIKLREGFSLKNPWDRRTLVHELAHHMQNMNGVLDRLACVAYAEPQAFYLEALWHEQHDGTVYLYSSEGVLRWIKKRCG